MLNREIVDTLWDWLHCAMSTQGFYTPTLCQVGGGPWHLCYVYQNLVVCFYYGRSEKIIINQLVESTWTPDVAAMLQIS